MDVWGWIPGCWGWLGTAAQGTAAAGASSALTGPEFPFWQHFFRVAAVLSGMLAVLILGLHLWKKSGWLRPKSFSPHIQVLATHYLAPKKALILVAVGKERLLLASAGEQLQLVTSLAPEVELGPAGEAPPSRPPVTEKEGSG